MNKTSQAVYGFCTAAWGLFVLTPVGPHSAWRLPVGLGLMLGGAVAALIPAATNNCVS